MIEEMLIKIIGTYDIKPLEYVPVDVTWICGCVVLILFIYIIFKGLMTLIKG